MEQEVNLLSDINYNNYVYCDCPTSPVLLLCVCKQSTESNVEQSLRNLMIIICGFVLKQFLLLIRVALIKLDTFIRS